MQGEAGDLLKECLVDMLTSEEMTTQQYIVSGNAVTIIFITMYDADTNVTDDFYGYYAEITAWPYNADNADSTTQYVYSPNLNAVGTASGNYEADIDKNTVVTIDGAEYLHVLIYYDLTPASSSSDSTRGSLFFLWAGSHSDYTYASIEKNEDKEAMYSALNFVNLMMISMMGNLSGTMEYYILGDSATLLFTSFAEGTYGFYAIVTGYTRAAEEVEFSEPTYSGHVFVGWYLDADCTVPFYDQSTLTQDTTVYARWIEVGGGTGGSTDPYKITMTITYDDTCETGATAFATITKVDKDGNNIGGEWDIMFDGKTSTESGTTTASGSSKTYTLDYLTDGYYKITLDASTNHIATFCTVLYNTSSNEMTLSILVTKNDYGAFYGNAQGSSILKNTQVTGVVSYLTLNNGTADMQQGGFKTTTEYNIQNIVLILFFVVLSTAMLTNFIKNQQNKKIKYTLYR